MVSAESAPATPRAIRTRLALLLVCVCVGAVIGVVGSAVTEREAWYLAIPAVVALGWLFVANPSECAPPVKRSGSTPPADTP